jgi:hypothetical protein
MNIGNSAMIGQIASLAMRFAEPTANVDFTSTPFLKRTVFNGQPPASRVLPCADA